MSSLIKTRPLRALALMAWLVSLAFVFGASTPSHHAEPAAAATAAPAKPNIVFVLTDDLSLDLLRFMPQVSRLRQEGLSFRNYFVSDSLCCPSRSSILTGRFPHNTKVFSNVGKYGGFRVFHQRDEERSTFATKLHRAGYRTGFMGKYLNGYLDPEASDVPKTYVPPGWSDWVAAGDAYKEFDYELNENGVVSSHGHAPEDYLTDVLAARGSDFIDRSTAEGKPFFLELAPFSPHSPYVPAPRDAGKFPGLHAPRPANFDVLPTHAPKWLARHPALTDEQIDRLDMIYRKRAQAVQSIDAMIERIRAALQARGVARNTYIVFSSDNGFHTGEHRLNAGKLTAYDYDIHVPLVVVGPGVPAGGSVRKMTENVDLAETFAELGGTRLRGDGQSLAPFLSGEKTPRWRDATLVEHHGADLRGFDPDFQGPPSGNPRTYEALRTPTALWVEYRGGEREYYDLTRDPEQLHNIAGRLSKGRRLKLHRMLQRLQVCRGQQKCTAAARLPR